MEMKNQELRELRQRLKWSNGEIADQLGVSVDTVKSWFRTQEPTKIKEPTLRLFRILADKAEKEDQKQ